MPEISDCFIALCSIPSILLSLSVSICQDKKGVNSTDSVIGDGTIIGFLSSDVPWSCMIRSITGTIFVSDATFLLFAAVRNVGSLVYSFSLL